MVFANTMFIPLMVLWGWLAHTPAQTAQQVSPAPLPPHSEPLPVTYRSQREAGGRERQTSGTPSMPPSTGTGPVRASSELIFTDHCPGPMLYSF